MTGVAELSPVRARISGETLLADLLAINDEIEASAADLERLVSLPSLSQAELATTRLRFHRALRRHLKQVDESVTGHLRATNDPATNRAVDEYRKLLREYHEAAARHVARWPSTSVATDWAGYRRSVADMLSRLRGRIAAERRDIHPLLSGMSSR